MSGHTTIALDEFDATLRPFLTGEWTVGEVEGRRRRWTKLMLRGIVLCPWGRGALDIGRLFREQR